MQIGGSATRRFVHALVCAFALTSICAGSAHAGPADDAIDRAAAQLQSAFSPSGGFGTRLAVRDVATAAEALRTYRPASLLAPAAAGYLATQTSTDVDSISRSALGQGSGATALGLVGSQQLDGGFGLTAEYQSDALDTALALRALVLTSNQSSTDKALKRLLAFAAGGAWGDDGGDVATTSEALLGLQAYVAKYDSTPAIDDARAAGSAWLASQSRADGSFAAGGMAVRSTSSAIAALSAFPTQVELVRSGADFLIGAQRPDGSWGDPFSTGLAIRGLGAALEGIAKADSATLADPQIKAKDITLNPGTIEPGESITATALVTNPGPGTATGVVAEFYLADPSLGGSPAASASLSSIAASGSVAVAKTFPAATSVGRQRVYVTLRTAADSDRDLSNNRAYANLLVRAAQSSYPKTRDWPRPGRDLQHSGSSPNRLHAVVDSTPVWRTPTNGGMTVAEGKVFFGVEQHLEAVNAKTGELAWQSGGGGTYPAGNPNYRPPVYNRGWVYSAGVAAAGPWSAKDGRPGVIEGGDDGDLLNKQIDVIPVDGAYDPMFRYRAGVNWINGSGNRCNLDPRRDQSGPFLDFPAWDEPNSEFPTSGNGIFFGRPCDGQALQFAGDGRRRAFVVNNDFLAAFDPATGRNAAGDAGIPFFTVELPGVAKADTAPLVDSLGQVIVTGSHGIGAGDATPDGKGTVIAASASDGAVYWHFETDTPLDGSPVEYRGAVIVIDRSGRLYALDQVTGALRWSWKPTGYTPPPADQQGPSGQTLALSGRYLYVPHPDGSLYTLDVRSGTQLSSTTFPARPYDLAIDDENNQIYVRTLDGYVGAYPTTALPTQCAPDPDLVPPVAGGIDRVSAQPGGAPLEAPGAYNADRPAMSADAKVVAWTTFTGAPAYETSISVRDLTTGQVTVVPHSDTVGTVTRFRPVNPVLSGDGRYLLYLANIINRGVQPFVLDRQTGVTEPALKNADGTIQPVSISDTPYTTGPVALSRDGRYVAFAGSGNVVPGYSTQAGSDLYIVDRETGERSVASAGQGQGDGVASPAFSADGRHVVFQDSYNLTGSPTGGTYLTSGPYVFSYDRVTGSTVSVSHLPNGSLVSGGSPAVSGDGRYVAYSAREPALQPADLKGETVHPPGSQIYLWDRATDTTELVSINEAGRYGALSAVSLPEISDDGRLVAFVTSPSGQYGPVFMKADNSFTDQIVVRDRATGTVSQVSYNRWGVAATGTSWGTQMSADGKRIGFLSYAEDLTGDDSNGVVDMFISDSDRTAIFRAGVTQAADEQSGIDCSTGGGTVAGYADLSVTSDSIRPSALEQGQATTVAVDITNQGSEPSEATTAALYDGTATTGKLIGVQPLAAVPAGATQTVSFPWASIARAGARTLTVVVDPDREVFEQDLTDNDASTDVVVAAPKLRVAVAGDQSSYGADAAVAVNATLSNDSLAARTVQLTVELRDDSGEVAQSWSDPVQLAAGGQIVVRRDWNTQDTNAGTYQLRAVVTNAGGDELAVATGSLTVTPDISASLIFAASDSEYAAGQTAQLRGIVFNTSRNASLTGARVVFAVTSPAGAPLGSWDVAAGDVAAGRGVLLSADRPLSGLPAGTYGASARLVSASGATLAEKTTTFALLSSALDGTGVTATLTASPSNPEQNAAATFNYAITNAGNAEIPGARLRVRLNDTQTGALAQTLDGPVTTVALGGPTAGQITGQITAPPADSYQAALYLVLSDGTEKPLNRTIISVTPAPTPTPTPTPTVTPTPTPTPTVTPTPTPTVTPTPTPTPTVTVGSSLTVAPRTSVLIWACSRTDEQIARAALPSDVRVSVVPDRSDPKYTLDPGCLLYTASERASFLRQLRSGEYSQAWLLGLPDYLEVGLGNEIAARVIAGDGLLNSSSSIGFAVNTLGGNRSPFGAYTSSLLPIGIFSMQFAASSAFAGLDAQFSGIPLTLSTTSASVLATTKWGIWPLQLTGTVATSNTFGDGKAIAIGTAPRTFATPAKAQAILTKASTVLQGAAPPARAGGWARLELSVDGQAPGSPLELRSQLPAGTTVPDLPAGATLTAGTLTVPFDNTTATRRAKTIWIKLPADVTAAQITTTAYYRTATGTTVAIGAPSTATLAITENRAIAAANATTALAAVGNATSWLEKPKLDKIRADVAAIAAASTDPNVHKTRINTLLTDIGTIESSSWTNTTPAWRALARLLTYAELDYYRYGGQ